MSQTNTQLNAGRVQVGSLREVARQELLELLDSLAGSKALVWDPGLTGPMGLVAEYSLLKEHGVAKMFSLAPGPLPPTNAEHVIFLTRPTLENMDTIAGNIKAEEMRGGSGVRQELHLVFTPRTSLLCEQRLVQAGVFGSLRVTALPVYLFPLDRDLLSLELPDCFSQLAAGDLTCLHWAATALTRLQAITGTIPRVYGKGTAAVQVWELLTRLAREAGEEDPGVEPQIDSLVVLDRGVDLVSALPTQLTYEGLLDELFRLDCASISLTEPENRVVPLSSQEELYQELRGLNFNAVGPTLSRKAKSISAQFEERHEARTVREIKQFVDRLPGMQTAKTSLALHTTLAEMVKQRIDSEEFLHGLELEQRLLVGGGEAGRYLDELEDLVLGSDVSPTKVLRLLCLQSVVCGGLKPRVLEGYRRLVMEAYGYGWLATLDRLSEAGLLCSTPSTRRPAFPATARRLNLIVDNVDEQNPSDIAYVHSVYAPLSVRLVQQLESPGWRNIREVLDTLPGPSMEDSQQVRGRAAGTKAGGRKTVLVFFVGGVTMAEVAALRFLSQQEDSTVEYLVATTSVVTGSSLLESLYTPLEAPPF